jgi:hypothetical protein
MNRQEAARTIEALEDALTALREVVVAEDGGDHIDPGRDLYERHQAEDGTWTARWVETVVVYRWKEQTGFAGPNIARDYGSEKWLTSFRAAERELRDSTASTSPG